jgi:adenylosuccinate synthase
MAFGGTMSKQRTAHLIADLGYGDSGKGTLTDFLARTNPVHTVIRANGGAQAGHGVVTPDGRRHTFSQFGSGTFVPGVRTYLSRHFILAPAVMLTEERHLAAIGVRDAFARTDISADALVITPFHRAVNRLREMLRGPAIHGSVGIGIGETAAHAERAPDEALRVSDLSDIARLRRKIARIQDSMCEHFRSFRPTTLPTDDRFGLEFETLHGTTTMDRWMEQLKPFLDVANIVDDAHFAALCAKPGDIVFEAAQGVLLDERRGFFPYCTRSTCTFLNPLGLLRDVRYDGSATRIAVLRAYGTRHGAGPFVTEDASLDADLPEPDGDDGSWAGHFRVGWPDLVALRYALDSCHGADALAVTCLDRIRRLGGWQVCTSYDLSGLTPEQQERCFEADGRIRLGRFGDLDHQTAITEALRSVKPVYSDVGLSDADGRRSMLLARIQDALGVPIKIVSVGPTANDKIII